MSILDYLSTLASAIGGQLPPPQPQTPQQPAPTFAPDASGNLQQIQTPPPQMPTAQPQQGGLTGFLSSPLTQGALGAYFGAIGAPKRSGLGGMLSQGGLEGLGAFGQAQRSAAQVPLMQQQLLQSQYQTEALRRQMQPINPQMQAALDQMQQQSTDPQEKQYLGLLEAQAKAGTITPQELSTAIEKWNEPKRMMAMMSAQYMPALMAQMGLHPATTAAPPTGGAAPTPAGPEPSAGTPFSMDIPGKGPATVVRDPNDNKLYVLVNGAWQPMTP